MAKRSLGISVGKIWSSQIVSPPQLLHFGNGSLIGAMRRGNELRE
jgi:hypothetical protein